VVGRARVQFLLHKTGRIQLALMIFKRGRLCWLDVAALCRLAGVDEFGLRERVNQGLLGPLPFEAHEAWRFDARALRRAVRMAALERGFDAVPELDDDSTAGQHARAVAGEYLNGHVRREFNVPGVTFGGRYDASPIIAADGSTPPPDAANSYQPSACPGGRPPHAWLADGRSLFDLFGFEWTLLVLKGPAGQGAAPTGGFEAAARALRVELKVVYPEAGEAPDQHGEQGRQSLIELYEAPLALIRPDHIVAWRGEDGASLAPLLPRVLGH
jgi:hypothetical protein